MSSHDQSSSANGLSSKANGSSKGFLGKLSFRVKPQGLVIDDDPYPLLDAIKTWIRETMGPEWTPEWTVRRTASNAGDIDRWAKGKDFVLLDHRLQGRFPGFQTGLDIGQHLVDKNSNLQILFYTGFKGDLKKAGTQTAYRDDFKEFQSHPNVTFYTKGELVPGKRLEELCQKITIAADGLRASMDTDEAKELRTLLGARVEGVKQTRYRFIDFDLRRARQTLRCLTDPGIGEIEIPTIYLKRAGLKSRNEDVVIKILEFDGGQVLSYIVSNPMNMDEIAEDVLKFLRDAE
jgi:hypothetical protein